MTRREAIERWLVAGLLVKRGDVVVCTLCGQDDGHTPVCPVGARLARVERGA